MMFYILWPGNRACADKFDRIFLPKDGSRKNLDFSLFLLILAENTAQIVYGYGGGFLNKNKYFLFLAFLAYSVFGWCYEVFLETVVYGWGFSNRGFLFGPYCPVYGFGALLLIFFLQPLQKKYPGGKGLAIVFIGTMVLATAAELLTSHILEALTGGWLWDYTSYAVQYDGRVALNPSLRFGFGGLLFLYGIQPLLEKAAEKAGEENCRKAGRVLAVFLLLDIILTTFRHIF